jgi:hypothetical protein
MLIYMLETVVLYAWREGQFWAPNPNYWRVKMLFFGYRSEEDM